MENKILVLLTFLSLISCSTNSGTEAGNPGTSSRTVTGSILSSVTTSCSDPNVSIDVTFANLNNNHVSTQVTNGFLNASLATTERYEVIFSQNGINCGSLFYGSGQTSEGLHVTLGKGTSNIPLGNIMDLGNGYFVADNDASSFCDDDGDEISDADDDDINGDGIEDGDDDDDGYFDWYEIDDNDEDDL